MASKQENFKVFFELLSKCPSNRMEKLFHHFIDVFCGQQCSIYEDYADIWSLEEWWDLLQESKHFFKLHQNSDIKITDLLSSLPTETQNILKDCLEVRCTDLKKTLIEKSHAVSPAFLNNFDWKLKLTLASDKMAQINEPRLLLDLDIIGDYDKLLCLDLSKKELKTLIDSMEKANKALMDYIIE
ncbi:COMM domain-containing protein 8-like [Stegodyphus dumicola]|uniref:COMM domain-containing protein 8-like n=1 Tax=Stegodyphus dumicola TaxID=202533 RepID=UPI0015B28D5F|nr:COMM domain-containing protein 8-like [Stegodyphus dumicola]